MSAVLMVPPYLTFLDNSFAPLAGGKIYTYAAGTTSPKATFTDSTGTTSASNPLVCDSQGRITIWGNGSYKFVVNDSSDNYIRTTDNMTTFTTAGAASASYFQSFSGTGSQTVFNLSTDLGTDENAVMVFVDAGGTSTLANTPFFQSFTASGGQTVYTLSQDLGTDEKTVLVYVNTTTKGYEVIKPTDFTISGTTLTLTTAPTVTGADSVLIFKNPILGTGTLATGRQILKPTDFTLASGATPTITFASAPASGTNNILIWAPSTLLGAAAASAASADASATIATAAAGTATAQQVIATTQAGISTTQATNSSNSATLAQTYAQALTATSTTANTIGTGAQSFVTQAGKQFQVGMFVLAVSASNNANFMQGQVTSYSGINLVLNITNVGGSGSISDWNIAVSGTRGAQGPSGSALADGNYGDVTVSGGSTSITINSSVVTEAKQLLADNTTNNVSITKHGYAPKAPNDATKYLDGTGAYSVPTATASNGGATTTSTGTSLTLTSSSNRLQVVTMTTYGLAVVLPDATTITTKGTNIFMIKNGGTYSFTVNDNAGQPKAILNAGEAVMLALSDNSTAKGIWATSSASNNGFVLDIIGTTTQNALTITTAGASGATPPIFAPISSTTTLAIWFDYNATKAFKCAVLTLSGEVLTDGSITTIETSTTTNPFFTACALDSTHVMAVYNTTAAVTKAMVISISGTTATANTSATVESALIRNLYALPISSSQVYLGYSKDSGTKSGGVVLGVSGTTVTVNAITYGAATIAATDGILSICQLSTTAYLYAYGGTTGYLAYQVFTVSGTTVTANTALTNQSNSIAVTNVVVTAISSTIALISCTQASGLFLYSISVTGTTPKTAQIKTGFYPFSNSNSISIFSPTTGTVILVTTYNLAGLGSYNTDFYTINIDTLTGAFKVGVTKEIVNLNFTGNTTQIPIFSKVTDGRWSYPVYDPAGLMVSANILSVVY